MTTVQTRTPRPDGSATPAPVLEPAAQAFADATAAPPYLHQLPPDVGRAEVGEVQTPVLGVPGTSVERIRVGDGLALDVFRPTAVTAGAYLRAALHP